MAEDNLKDNEDRIDAGFRGLNARLDTLDSGVRTLDNGLADVRADLGEFKAHVDEVRDALLADNDKNRDFMDIKLEALRSEVKVYAALLERQP